MDPRNDNRPLIVLIRSYERIIRNSGTYLLAYSLMLPLPIPPLAGGELFLGAPNEDFCIG